MKLERVVPQGPRKTAREEDVDKLVAGIREGGFKPGETVRVLDVPLGFAGFAAETLEGDLMQRGLETKVTAGPGRTPGSYDILILRDQGNRR